VEFGIDVAHPLDAAAIADIHVRGWTETFRGALAGRLLSRMDEEGIAARWQQIIETNEQLVLTAVDRQCRMLGFAASGKPSGTIDGFDAELHKLYVLREFQGRGVGRQLLLASIARLRAMGFRSLASHVLANAPARNFYEHFGARLIRVAPITIDGDSYMDALYGWPSLDIALVAPESRAADSRQTRTSR